MEEHIDGRLLNNNLRYRFDYLSKFLNFTSTDINILNSLASITVPILPVITDAVYRKLFSFDVTKQYFIESVHCSGTMSTDNENNNKTLLSEQLTLRKDMLNSYLKRVLTETNWNDEFLEYLYQIGRIHTNKSGYKSIHIDYIHINALFGYLENFILDFLYSNENLNKKTKHSMIMTINKLFWIQNDFFTLHYMTFWNEYSHADTLSTEKTTSCCCC